MDCAKYEYVHLGDFDILAPQGFVVDQRYVAMNKRCPYRIALFWYFSEGGQAESSELVSDPWTISKLFVKAKCPI